MDHTVRPTAPRGGQVPMAIHQLLGQAFRCREQGKALVMQVGRRIVRGDAVMVLSIDDPIPPALLATINGINGIQEAHPVTL